MKPIPRIDRADRTTRDLRPTKVAKTLWPGMPGTRALCDEHGEQLVCVRYRHGQVATVQYKTVELVVSEARIAVRPANTRLYGVHIDWQEFSLARKARQLGAKWDQKTDLWQMTGAAVIQLKIQHRVRER